MVKIVGHRPWVPPKAADGTTIANPTAFQRAIGFLPLKVKNSSGPPRTQGPSGSALPSPVKNEIRNSFSTMNAALQAASPHQTMLACLIKADGYALDQRLRAGDFGHAELSLKHAREAMSEMKLQVPKSDASEERVPEAFRMLYRDFDALPVLRDMKPEHRHRLAIDPSRLRDFDHRAASAGIDARTSPYAGLLFEEKGYLFGMANGYKLAFEHVDRKLSPGLLVGLHAASTAGNKALQGGFNDKGGEGVRWELGPHLSPTGLKEFQQLSDELLAGDPTMNILSVRNVGGNTWETGSRPAAPGTVEKVVGEWIDQYHETLEKIGAGADAESNHLRLLAAVQCLQKCLRIHPFADGTGRLFQQVALNRELAHLGLPISLLDEPTKLHCRGLDEVLDLVIDGMRDAQGFMKDGAPDALKQAGFDVPRWQRQQYFQRFMIEFSHQGPRQAAASTSALGSPHASGSNNDRPAAGH